MVSADLARCTTAAEISWCAPVHFFRYHLHFSFGIVTYIEPRSMSIDPSCGAQVSICKINMSDMGVWADGLCTRQPRIKKRLLHQAQKDWCTRRNERQTCTIEWFYPSCSRCMDLRGQNRPRKSMHLLHHGVCVKGCEKEHTLTLCQSWGHRTKWNQGGRPGATIQDPTSERKSDALVVFYLFLIDLSHFSVSSQCHFKHLLTHMYEHTHARTHLRLVCKRKS